MEFLELGLPPKQKEIQRWAAHGLAYTCAVLYADQKSGLGPDQIRIRGKGRRWMEVVEEWEMARLGGGGRQQGDDGDGGDGGGGGNDGGDGEVPPGMGEPEPELDPGKRDYFSTNGNYYLRPEVSKKEFNSFFSFFFSLTVY